VPVRMNGKEATYRQNLEDKRHSKINPAAEAHETKKIY
jgi:hypothetical protein